MMLLWDICTAHIGSVLHRLVAYLPLRSVLAMLHAHPPMLGEIQLLPEPSCDWPGCSRNVFASGVLQHQCPLCNLLLSRCSACTKRCWECNRAHCDICDNCEQCGRLVCSHCVEKHQCRRCGKRFCGEFDKERDLRECDREVMEMCDCCGEWQCLDCGAARDEPNVDCSDCKNSYCHSCAEEEVVECTGCDGGSYCRYTCWRLHKCLAVEVEG